MSGNTLSKGISLVFAGALLACSTDAAAPEEPSVSLRSHQHAQPGSANTAAWNKALAALRAHTASWHNAEKAAEAGYNVEVGCSDERALGVDAAVARGMGFHTANLPLLADDSVSLLEPETLVYGRMPSGKLRLAGFDYFVPESPRWPRDGAAPMLLDMPLTFVESHGGWMAHVWAWWHNPDGMFENYNSDVPLCECEVGDVPGEALCMPT